MAVFSCLFIGIFLILKAKEEKKRILISNDPSAKYHMVAAYMIGMMETIMALESWPSDEHAKKGRGEEQGQSE